MHAMSVLDNYKRRRNKLPQWLWDLLEWLKLPPIWPVWILRIFNLDNASDTKTHGGYVGDDLPEYFEVDLKQFLQALNSTCIWKVLIGMWQGLILHVNVAPGVMFCRKLDTWSGRWQLTDKRQWIKCPFRPESLSKKAIWSNEVRRNQN